MLPAVSFIRMNIPTNLPQNRLKICNDTAMFAT